MKLKDYLEYRNISYAEFADMIGISPSAISKYCSGQRVPTLEIACKIQEATRKHVSFSDLMPTQK